MIKWFILLLCIATISLFLPLKRFEIIKKIMPSLVVAAAVGMGTYGIADQIVKKQNLITVQIEALNEKNENAEGYDVFFRGASIDGKWMHAAELCPNSTWIVNDDIVLGWRNYDQPEGMKDSISFKMPQGNEQMLVFDSNKWQGKVKVVIGDQELVVDNYVDSEQTADKGINLPIITVEEKYKNIPVIAGVVALIGMFCLCMYLYSKDKSKKRIENGNAREIWADILRIIFPFIIVWLHCTCNIYTDWYDPNSQKWFMALYINCFTAFAVPGFFLLSGAFLMKKEVSIETTLKKRLPKIIIPLFSWSIIYILINIFVYKNENNLFKGMIKMLFGGQYYHLWFMYPLMGLYFMLPVITFIYYKASKSLKKYILVLVLIVPSIIQTACAITGISVSQPWFTLGFPELGLFILGAWLTQEKKGWRMKSKLWGALAFAGYGLNVSGSYYISLRTGAAQKVLFSQYGTVPVILYTVGFFMFFYSKEEKWQRLSDRWKQLIHSLAGISMGIYYTHMLWLLFVGNTSIMNIGVTNNSGSLINMFIGAIVYFCISIMFCLCGCQIPILGKIFGEKTELTLPNVFEKREIEDKKIILDQRVSSIDGLRAISALVIALFHFEIYFPIIEGGIFNTGYFAVEFFFILSGFLLAKDYMKRSVDGKVDIISFMWRKIRRLYPVYFTMIIGVGMIYALKWYRGNYIAWLVSRKNWLQALITEILCIQSLGFTANKEYQMINGPAWYVSALLIATLVLILLFNWIKYKRMVAFSFVITCVFYGLLIKYGTDPNSFMLGVLPTAMIRAIAGMTLGIVVYGVQSRLKDVIRKMKYVYVSCTEIILILSYTFLLTSRSESYFNYLVLPISALLLIFAFSTQGLGSKFLSNKVLRFIGKISFSFYISQSMCSNVFTCFWPDIKQPFSTLLYLILNLFVAWILYVGVENRKKKMIKECN